MDTDFLDTYKKDIIKTLEALLYNLKKPKVSDFNYDQVLNSVRAAKMLSKLAL